MRPLRIIGAETMILGLQDEIRQSQESRYDLRLHEVLVVAQGLNCPDVGRLLGDSPRTVKYCVQRFKTQEVTGLREGERTGHRQRLSEAQIGEVDRALYQTRRD